MPVPQTIVSSAPGSPEWRLAEAALPPVRRALCARATDEARTLTAVLRAAPMREGLVFAGAVMAFDTLEMALAVNATDASTLLLELDAATRDFPRAADALVAFLAAPFPGGGTPDDAPFRDLVRADASGLRRSFLAFDLDGAGLDAREYRFFDAHVSKHASSKRWLNDAATRLSDLLCGDAAARDDDLRAALAPAFDVLRRPMCPTTPRRPAAGGS